MKPGAALLSKTGLQLAKVSQSMTATTVPCPVLGPDTTSTSPCDERYSSVRSFFGSDRTTSSSSRAGTTAEPSRSGLALTPTRTPSSISVAWSSTWSPSACSITPASVWIALRVDAPRAATPRAVRNGSFSIVNFI